MLKNFVMARCISFGITSVMLLVGACSPIKTYVEQTNEAVLGRSYAFVSVSELDPASAMLYDEIRRRIVSRMEAQRYQLDTASPDMLIAFNVMTEAQNRETTRTVDPLLGRRGIWAYPYDPRWAMNSYRYKEVRLEKTGTLVLDILSDDYQLRWRGVGTGPVNNPDERFETSYRIVDKLLKRLPRSGGVVASVDE